MTSTSTSCDKELTNGLRLTLPQSRNLAFTVSKPERVLVLGGTRRLVKPVEGELRVDKTSFALKSHFVPEKPDRATGSLDIRKHRRMLGFNLELRRNRLTATVFARTSKDEPVVAQVFLFYRIGEKAPPRRAPEKAPSPITMAKPSTPTPVAPTPAEKLATSQASISGGREISSYEQRLSGHWVYQEFYSSGRGELHMMLLRNGRCVRTSNSVASLILHDSAGNWAGFMERASALDPGDRGKWRFDGRLLTLEMDDDSTYEYTVTLSGTSMTTRNTTGGAQRLWTKER